MRSVLQRALEGEFVAADTPPESDTSVMIFRDVFGNMQQAGAAAADGSGTVLYALEERANGEAEDEIEHTLYACLDDQTQLKSSSSMEHQEQWEIRLPKVEGVPGNGSMRVRKTWIDGGEPDYVRATKIKANDAGDKIELPMPSSEIEFIAFRFLSPQGMIKDRFHFPVTGTKLVWEVDMFPKEGGGYHPWCKIDLEVTDRKAPLPELPIQFSEVILPKEFKKLDETEWEEKVTKLYDEYFLTKNIFVSGKAKNAQSEEGTDETPIATGEEANKPEGGEEGSADPTDAAVGAKAETPPTPKEVEPGVTEKPQTDEEAGQDTTAKTTDEAAPPEQDPKAVDEVSEDEENKKEPPEKVEDTSKEGSGSDSIGSGT